MYSMLKGHRHLPIFNYRQICYPKIGQSYFILVICIYVFLTPQRVKGHVEFYLMGMSSQKDSKEALWWVCLVCVWQIPGILKERRLSIKI